MRLTGSSRLGVTSAPAGQPCDLNGANWRGVILARANTSNLGNEHCGCQNVIVLEMQNNKASGDIIAMHANVAEEKVKCDVKTSLRGS